MRIFLKESPTALIQKLKVKIEENKWKLEWNWLEWKFNLPVQWISWKYSIQDHEFMDITIFEKPFLISDDLIERKIRDTISQLYDYGQQNAQEALNEWSLRGDDTLQNEELKEDSEETTSEREMDNCWDVEQTVS